MIDKEQKKWVTEKWGENEEPEETPTERPHAVSKNKEQIIVDGVDVSRCEHWNICKQCQLSQLPESGYKLLCKDNLNCSFKQLTRKTQECEELKRKVELMMDCPDCKVDEYKEALEEIEGIIQAIMETNRVYPLKNNLAKILNIINKAEGDN